MSKNVAVSEENLHRVPKRYRFSYLASSFQYEESQKSPWNLFYIFCDIT